MDAERGMRAAHRHRHREQPQYRRRRRSRSRSRSASNSRSRSPVRRRRQPPSNSRRRDRDAKSVFQRDRPRRNKHDTKSAGPRREKETDARRLSQRQKQIDFGKNTIGYDRYVEQVPKQSRKRRHPVTPDKTEVMSKRVWDSRIRAWRRALHAWDPPEEPDVVPTAAVPSAAAPTATATATAATTATAGVMPGGNALPAVATAVVDNDSTGGVFNALEEDADGEAEPQVTLDAEFSAELAAFEDDDLL